MFQKLYNQRAQSIDNLELNELLGIDTLAEINGLLIIMLLYLSVVLFRLTAYSLYAAISVGCAF